MSGLRGNVRKLTGLAAALKGATVKARQRIAAAAAPDLTSRALGTFSAGQNVYGDAFGQGVTGRPITLVKSGAMRQTIRFVNIGTRVRCVIGVKYAKYHIGRYKMLPPGRSAMPIAWSKGLSKIATKECDRALGGLL